MNQDQRCDILVCGAGPAGISAAVSAARKGSKVILLERYGFLGGAASANLVNPFMVPAINGERLVKGIFSEIEESLIKRGACKEGSLFGQAHLAFDPEVYKLLLFDMVERAGVNLLLHSTASAVIVKDNSVKGVITSGKSGEVRIFSKTMIDCTGDADIAYMSGVETEKGREGDQLTQPPSLMFRVAGIDSSRMPDHETMNAIFLEAKKKGSIRTPREKFLWFETTRPGEIHINTTRVPKKDGTSVFDLTKAEIESRKQVDNLFLFLKEKVSGFENAYISAIAPHIGVRETRRIKGVYTLNVDDVVEGRKFDDPIAKNNYPVDIHSPDGHGTSFKPLGPSVYYEIPYRCLVPKNIDNLLVAGRCISATHEALSSTRIMPVCMATGQAAGLASVISLKRNAKLRNIDYKELREDLNQQNAGMR